MEKHATARRRHVIKRDAYELRQVLDLVLERASHWDDSMNTYTRICCNDEPGCNIGYMKLYLQAVADTVLSEVRVGALKELAEEFGVPYRLVSNSITLFYERMLTDLQTIEELFGEGIVSGIKVWSPETLVYEILTE